MDPATEPRSLDSAHVRAWKLWWCLEGKHLDNGRRHPDCQLQNPPGNAQCAHLDVLIHRENCSMAKSTVEAWLSKPPTKGFVSIALDVTTGIFLLVILGFLLNG